MASSSLKSKRESETDEFSAQSKNKGDTVSVTRKKKIVVSLLLSTILCLLLAGFSWYNNSNVHKHNSLDSRLLMNIFESNSPNEETFSIANRKKTNKAKTTKHPKATKALPQIKTTKTLNTKKTATAPTIKAGRAPILMKQKKRDAPIASITSPGLTPSLEDYSTARAKGKGSSYSLEDYTSSGVASTARAKGKGSSYSLGCVDDDGDSIQGGKGGNNGGKGKGTYIDYSLAKGGKGKGGKGGKGNKSRRLKSGKGSEGKGSKNSKSSEGKSSKGGSQVVGKGESKESKSSKGKGSSYSEASGKGESKESKSSKGKGSSGSKGEGGSKGTTCGSKKSKSSKGKGSSGSKGGGGSKGSGKGSTGGSKGKGKGGTPTIPSPPTTPSPPTSSPSPDDSCTTWSLVADIDGENRGDYAAGVQGLMMSGNGLVVAVGSRFADANGNITDSGAVAVYEVINGIWVMRGSPIYGLAAGNFLGHSVDLSFDGNILVVGSPNADADAGTDAGTIRVFDWNGSVWVERSFIGGRDPGDLFGLGVSMNDAGTRIAIGASNGFGNVEDSGYVIVIEWDGSTWNSLGDILTGLDASDDFGYALDMDSVGNTIIVGAQDVLAEVFMYNGADWVQKGSALVGGSSGKINSVAINGNGNVVIVGNSENAGDATIFEYNGSDWVQKGNTIFGSFENDGFGTSVSINSNGDIVAIGAPFNDEYGDNAGKVTIYAFDNASKNWQPVVAPEGEYYGDMAGSSVSLNSEGNCLAVGAEGHDDYYGEIDWDNGQVRIICCFGDQ